MRAKIIKKPPYDVLHRFEIGDIVDILSEFYEEKTETIMAKVTTKELYTDIIPKDCLEEINKKE